MRNINFINMWNEPSRIQPSRYFLYKVIGFPVRQPDDANHLFVLLEGTEKIAGVVTGMMFIVLRLTKGEVCVERSAYHPIGDTLSIRKAIMEGTRDSVTVTGDVGDSNSAYSVQRYRYVISRKADIMRALNDQFGCDASDIRF